MNHDHFDDVAILNISLFENAYYGVILSERKEYTNDNQSIFHKMDMVP